MSVQLPLGLCLNDSQTLSNFIAGINEAAVVALRECVSGNEQQLYLWSPQSLGKTHLLQAAAHLSAGQGQAPAYLPLPELIKPGPGVLEGMENMRLVCIDDVQAIAGNRDWEEALFNLYNRVRANGGQMIFSANAAPQHIGLQLPDLVTRLGWGAVFQLQEPADNDKMTILQQRAASYGFELSDEVCLYLLRRLPRDMHALMSFLDTVEQQSLRRQRKVTIPFVRELMNDSAL